MRTLFGLALLLVVLALVGWITFSNEPGQKSIHLQTDEIQQDADEAIQQTEEALEKGARELSESLESGDEDRPSADDQSVDPAHSGADKPSLEESPR